MPGATPQPESSQEKTSPGTSVGEPVPPQADTGIPDHTAAPTPPVPGSISYFSLTSEQRPVAEVAEARAAQEPVLKSLMQRGYQPSQRHFDIQAAFVADFARLSNDAEAKGETALDLLGQALRNCNSDDPWTIELRYKDTLPIRTQSAEAFQERFFAEWLVRSVPYGSDARTGQLLTRALADSFFAFGAPGTGVCEHLCREMLRLGNLQADGVNGEIAEFMSLKSGLNPVNIAALLKTARGSPPEAGLEIATERFVHLLTELYTPVAVPPPPAPKPESRTWRTLKGIGRAIKNYIDE